MKNSTKLIITTVLYFMFFNTYANDLSYEITTKKSVVLISFSNQTSIAEEVLIQVTNEEGEVFLEKTIQVTEDIKEEFSVASLEKGEYTFRMKFEDKILLKDFKLSNSKRISMRGYYSMRTSNRSFIVSVSGPVMKIETNDYMTGNLKLKFKTPNGSEEIYEASFLSGENNIAKIDLRTFGVSQFVLDLSDSDVTTYTDTFSMF